LSRAKVNDAKEQRHGNYAEATMKKQKAKSRKTPKSKKSVKDLTPAQQKMVRGGQTSQIPRGVIDWRNP